MSRGLLDETLIVMCGEMGRTPRISPIAVGGKERRRRTLHRRPSTHWGDVFPCFFAGAGIRAGQVIGQTDKQGASPASEAYTPADMAATMYHLLGIGPDREFHDSEGRPFRIYQGQPIGAVAFLIRADIGREEAKQWRGLFQHRLLFVVGPVVCRG